MLFTRTSIILPVNRELLALQIFHHPRHMYPQIAIATAQIKLEHTIHRLVDLAAAL